MALETACLAVLVVASLPVPSAVVPARPCHARNGNAHSAMFFGSVRDMQWPMMRLVTAGLKFAAAVDILFVCWFAAATL
jgi:hypothetical protein